MESGEPRSEGWSKIGISGGSLYPEARRLLFAFLLYVCLYPVWNLVGLGQAYSRAVWILAVPSVLHSQHFVTYLPPESLSGAPTPHGFAVLFALCLAMVSTRLRWSARASRFGSLLLLVFSTHVLASVVDLKYDSAVRLLRDGLSVYSSSYFHWLESVTRLMNVVGLQAIPFACLALAAYWNLGGSARDIGADPRATNAATRGLTWRWRPRLAMTGMMAVSGVIIVCLILLSAQMRNRNAIHKAAHVSLGKYYLRHEAPTYAELEFEMAVDEGSRDGDAWLLLALLRARQNRSLEAREILRRGLQVVEDSRWRERTHDYLRADEIFAQQ